jgi:hypothetical protein
MEFRLAHGFRQIIAALVLSIGSSATAEEVSCPGIDVMVSGADDTDALCTLVEQSIEDMSRCDLHQSAPISIHILTAPIDGNPTCLGLFHCKTNEILLRTPQSLSAALGPEHPLGILSKDRLFDSLVVHELAHALLYQSRGDTAKTRAEDEYIAYAMQYAFLNDRERAALLAQFETSTFGFEFLNDITYGFSPNLFGAFAWQHYSQPGNGCAFVRKIIDQDIDFQIHDFYSLEP